MKNKLLTHEQAESARVTQAEFGRLVGISRSRINQLVKAGLLRDDGQGLNLVESLKNYWAFRAERRHCGCLSPEQYFYHLAWRI